MLKKLYIFCKKPINKYYKNLIINQLIILIFIFITNIRKIRYLTVIFAIINKTLLPF